VTVLFIEIRERRELGNFHQDSFLQKLCGNHLFLKEERVLSLRTSASQFPALDDVVNIGVRSRQAVDNWVPALVPSPSCTLDPPPPM
jgi:hypothetical protein